MLYLYSDVVYPTVASKACLHFRSHIACGWVKNAYLGECTVSLGAEAANSEVEKPGSGFARLS